MAIRKTGIFRTRLVTDSGMPSGDQMAGVLLDDDGDTGEAARDQAGRLQHGSDGKGHQSRADDDEQIISDKGSDSCS